MSSRRWTPALTTESYHEVEKALHSMKMAATDSPPPAFVASEQAMEAAAILLDQLPDADWLIEQDIQGNVRITLYLPPGK